MQKAKLYNGEGNIVGEVNLPADIFGVPVEPSFVHEMMRSARANARVAIAHTKMRSDVRGGGKKPWKQKGTGRARHGSIRSPIWVGGGVAGGPRSDRNFAVKVNRKAKRKALCMALSDKANTSSIVVLDAFALPEAKTKLVAGMVKKLPVGKKTLLVLPKSDAAIFRASRNLPAVKTVTANALSLVDALTFSTIVLPQATLETLQSLYGTK